MRQRLSLLPLLAGGAALIALASIFACNPNRNNMDLYKNQSSGVVPGPVSGANSQNNAYNASKDERSAMNTPTASGYGTAGQNTAGTSGSTAQQPGAQPTGGPAAFSSSRESANTGSTGGAMGSGSR